MGFRWLIGLAGLLLASSAVAQPAKAPDAQPPVWTRLERFSSEADFARYMHALRRVQRLRGLSERRGVQYAQAEAVLCPDGSLPPCRAPAAHQDGEEVVVTGTIMRNSSASVSAITNVQTLGVDEGDVVKQIGQYLIVLQDGRLFVADTRPGGRPGLALSTRINVYRKDDADTWYDELLVTPDRVLVTGYNYDLGAAEYNVFAFRDGRLSREATYYISSDDYYDIDNYASRLIDGRLVLYTPINLWDIDIDDDAPKWPMVRRWLREDERGVAISAGRHLFDARDIYRPVSRSLDPTLHTISVCPLGTPRAGDELECESRGFIAGGERQFFVSTSDVYLWTTPSWYEQSGDYSNECGGADALGPNPATVFRVPVRGSAPTAIFARGRPLDQFGMASTDTEFRALLAWNSGYCAGSDQDVAVRYFHAPFSAFSNRPRSAAPYNYLEAPSPMTAEFGTRFLEHYVVYGGRTSSYANVPDDGETRTARVVALSLDGLNRATVLQTNHDAMRVDRVGDNAIVTGYGSDRGLSISMVRLTHGAPAVADTTLLEGRYESEGRSHAFNSLVDEDNAGLMGVPTVTRTRQAGRWWDYSRASDVSFLAVDANARLKALGPLRAAANARDPRYQCQVSCIDWYGNSRPIFTDGRVFALSETEIIEGTVEGGAIREIRRLNLTVPPPAS